MIIFFTNIFLIYKYQPDIIKKKQRKDSKKSHERYQNLTKEERNRKGEYGHEQYELLSEDKK